MLSQSPDLDIAIARPACPEKFTDKAKIEEENDDVGCQIPTQRRMKAFLVDPRLEALQRPRPQANDDGLQKLCVHLKVLIQRPSRRERRPRSPISARQRWWRRGAGPRTCRIREQTSWCRTTARLSSANSLLRSANSARIDRIVREWRI